ncbi:MAG: hypothetical protein AAGM38_17360 [Pseudomonadota bacterium]
MRRPAAFACAATAALMSVAGGPGAAAGGAPLIQVEAGEAAAAAFDAVADGAIMRLDFSVRIDAERDPEWRRAAFGLAADECPFGALTPIAAARPPSGDPALLLEIRLGAPERHAANLASCEHVIDERGPGAALRLRGCFLAHLVSVPTARLFVLHPLEAAACAG